ELAAGAAGADHGALGVGGDDQRDAAGLALLVVLDEPRVDPRRHQVAQRQLREGTGADARGDARGVAEAGEDGGDRAAGAAGLHQGAYRGDLASGLGELADEVHLIDGGVADDEELGHSLSTPTGVSAGALYA